MHPAGDRGGGCGRGGRRHEETGSGWLLGDLECCWDIAELGTIRSDTSRGPGGRQESARAGRSRRTSRCLRHSVVASTIMSNDLMRRQAAAGSSAAWCAARTSRSSAPFGGRDGARGGRRARARRATAGAGAGRGGSRRKSGAARRQRCAGFQAPTSRRRRFQRVCRASIVALGSVSTSDGDEGARSTRRWPQCRRAPPHRGAPANRWAPRESRRRRSSEMTARSTSGDPSLAPPRSSESPGRRAQVGAGSAARNGDMRQQSTRGSAMLRAEDAKSRASERHLTHDKRNARPGGEGSRRLRGRALRLSGSC